MDNFNPIVSRTLSKEEQKEKINVLCPHCSNTKNISKLAYRKNIEKNDGKYRCKSCAQKNKTIPIEQRNKIRATLKGETYISKEIIHSIVLFDPEKIIADKRPVLIQCSCCGENKQTTFRDAIINYNRNNKNFICRKCTLITNNPVFNKNIISKIKKTNLKKYGTECSMNSIEIISNREKQIYSQYEFEIYNFIKSIDNNCTVLQNNRSVIFPYELDIYLPDYKLAIEFNGIYWHSYDRIETVQEKRKHLFKTLQCEKKNINLIHIFENEWIDPVKKSLWKSMIQSKMNKNQRIYARNCNVMLVCNTEAKKFLDENHLQGHCRSSINIGLYHNETLYSLMTFSKCRFNKNYQWEIIRYCCKKQYNIIGGPSKLLTYFIRNYNPINIISYADRRHSNGNMYENIGMKKINVSPPNYFYFKLKDKIMYSRIQFQKHKLSSLLEKFNSSQTESENMFKNDYRRIWDCGNLVYAWKSLSILLLFFPFIN